MKNAWKRILFMLCAVVSMTALVAEETLDVIYMKNGTVIKGTITEQTPGDSLTIETKDGLRLPLRFTDIARIAKENKSAETTPKTADDETPKKLPGFVLSVDPLGFAQFGPIVKGDIHLLQSLYLHETVRFHGIGLVTKLIHSAYNPTAELSLDPSSLAFGIGAINYFSKRPGEDAPYLSGNIEYGWDTGTTEPGERWESRWDIRFVTIFTGFGYRWRFPPMDVSVGLLGGVNLQTSNDWWYVNSSYASTAKRSSAKITTPFAMLEITIGLEI